MCYNIFSYFVKKYKRKFKKSIMKQKIEFVCSSCRAKSPKWQGKCNNCGAWDSFVEDINVVAYHKTKKNIQRANAVKLKDIEQDSEIRIKTGITELDRVLGGGIIPGSLVLVGGDPGIGKSTIMLQMCRGLSPNNPLYATGEESLRQIAFRASRLSGIPQELAILAETNIEIINNAILSSEYGMAIVDSIQSVFTDRVEAAPGSIAQVRECAALLMNTAKTSGKPVFIIGHVTKDGMIAGPKLLEHLVDTVLQFEGDKTYSFRILRALKNRYGSTNEIGIFEMSEQGLIEVKNPSEIFLAQRNGDDSGIAVVAAMEGARPILLEVQALVSPTGFAVPQRTTTGFDIRRLNMILAVLEKRLGEKFRMMDVFVNIAGGIYLNDPAVDLGIAAALVSSLRDKPINSETLLIGEIGLTGEVRSVSNIEQRLSEAQKLGFKRAFIPSAALKKLSKPFKIKLIPVERISLAFAELF